MIVKYCGKTLKKLSFAYYNSEFNNRNLFPALEHLELLNANLKNFPLDSPVKYLKKRNGQAFIA